MTTKWVEKHVIRKNTETIDDISFKCKNLYNAALYTIRQEFIRTSKLKEEGLVDHATVISYFDLCKSLKTHEAYKELPSSTAQQTLKLVSQTFKSFIKSIKDWSKNPGKYKGRPKMPKYMDKEKGRAAVIFTNQAARLKEGFLHFPRKTGLQPRKTKIPEGSLCQVRFIPRLGYYCMEVVYTKETKVDETLVKDNRLGIDLGVNNLATMLNAQTGECIIINGRGLKSLNRYFNKKKAAAQSTEDKEAIKKLSIKRTFKINDLMHKASRWIINYCQENKIGTIVIGKNKGWKTEINIGKVNNQKFVSIPFESLIQKVQYKAEAVGIEVILQEEAYTSKVDHLAMEPMCKQDKYLGRRVHRGLFKSSTGIVLNADLNGAIGIIRKVAGDTWVSHIKSLFDSKSVPIKKIALSENL